MTEALWYAGRATGLVTLGLFTIALALGIATRSGRQLAGLPRFAVSALHRNVSLLGLAFLAVHIGSLFFDPYAQLRIADVILPFASTYRPLWTGFGVVAFDLAVAVTATSLLRRRIGPRAWKILHWLSYAMWPLAAVHAIGSGSDAGQLWMIGCVLLCGLVVVAAVVWRLDPGFAEISQLGRRKVSR
ncbi:ferric reductase-like transmembrane domain-containing protein [Fodinicola acaciae]|uniref:ferric reductase-like transmembrane domain-containing protein n=1 Tax=Fodinicola acaciae TaxID=2681555 RepID=UPI0013D22B5A|nr:ferric reductase-like transmembrane domain-containing protein [Fodinicola acaciae]